jgi:hypothetical protein
MKIPSQSNQAYQELMIKASLQVSEWNSKLERITELLKSETEPQFGDIQEFVMDRLTSQACATNQGYVMSGFGLDSEKASTLFLENSDDDDVELNYITKPDYVVIINRSLEQEDLCLKVESEDDKTDDTKTALLEYQ